MSAEIQSRADQLLRRYLSETQRASYDAYCGFEAIGGLTGRTYWIQASRALSWNVSRDDGRIYCCQLQSGLPYGDHVLAQKLLIEANESDFLRNANVKDGGRE